jgi:hypothetical protein
MANAKQMILLVGEETKNLRKFIPWEIELARKKDIPIIVVNLNGKRDYDADRCPSAVNDGTYTIDVSFNAKIIQYALDKFPADYEQHKSEKEGHWHYKNSVYESLGL